MTMVQNFIGIFMPFHIAVTNNTQEAGYFQNISTSGSWNPSFPPEVDAFETASATVMHTKFNAFNFYFCRILVLEE